MTYPGGRLGSGCVGSMPRTTEPLGSRSRHLGAVRARVGVHVVLCQFLLQKAAEGTKRVVREGGAARLESQRRLEPKRGDGPRTAVQGKRAHPQQGAGRVLEYSKPPGHALAVVREPLTGAVDPAREVDLHLGTCTSQPRVNSRPGLQNNLRKSVRLLQHDLRKGRAGDSSSSPGRRGVELQLLRRNRTQLLRCQADLSLRVLPGGRLRREGLQGITRLSF